MRPSVARPSPIVPRVTVAAMRVRAAAGGLALALTAGWNLANIGAVADRISDAYGVSLAVVGLITTALLVTHAAVQIPAGRLCDRFGARLVGIAGLTVVAAASTLALTWREVGFAMAMRLVAGHRHRDRRSSPAATTSARPSARAFAQGLYGAASMASGGLALVLVPALGRLAGAVRDRGDPRRPPGALVLVAAPRERARPPLVAARCRASATAACSGSPRCTAPRSACPS